MNSISDKSVDMILCDLPYGTTKCKWDIVGKLDSELKEKCDKLLQTDLR